MIVTATPTAVLIVVVVVVVDIFVIAFVTVVRAAIAMTAAVVVRTANITSDTAPSARRGSQARVALHHLRRQIKNSPPSS